MLRGDAEHIQAQRRPVELSLQTLELPGLFSAAFSQLLDQSRVQFRCPLGQASSGNPCSAPPNYTHTQKKKTLLLTNEQQIGYKPIQNKKVTLGKTADFLSSCVAPYCRRSHLSITATVSCCYGNSRPPRALQYKTAERRAAFFFQNKANLKPI